ncbi:tRNA methyltransferase [Helicobacter salomonis]|uniref:tRNA methyltransferase n=1 Tax=Helicobacter salomonis TaxID=56878 RepID=UPI0018F838B8|nr:tRNA methyltransferase [Helicobacter salomonis]
MIRLLLLALLALNLQAKEDVLTIMIQIDNPKESQNAPFFKAFKALKTYFDRSVDRIQKEYAQTKEPDNPRAYSLRDLAYITAQYTDASIPLAKAVVAQIPLLQEFKPKNQREELFLAHVRDMEMLHALDVLDSLINCYSCQPKATAHIFLDVIAFLYAPLINAHKAGLDVIAYLQQLHKGISQKQLYGSIQKIGDFNMARVDEKLLKHIVPHKPFRKRLVQDMDRAETLMGISRQEWGFWALSVLDTRLGGSLDADRDDLVLNDQGLSEFLEQNAQRIDPEHLFDLYATRIIPLERNAPFYDLLKNDDPKTLKDTLKDHPTMCLSPKYLSPKSQQTCLQLFQAQTYNAKDIQEQLHLVRLVSIDDSPCMYLDPKDKLQIFKSSNALCLALQKSDFREHL